MCSVGPRWIAASGIPVLVRTRPELHEQLLHPRELDVIDATGGSVEFVAFRVFVGVVVPDEGQVLEGTQMNKST